jgi:hypothetical protein
VDRGRSSDVRGKARVRAGLDDEDLHFHDLRGTAVARLALAGCSTAEIAALPITPLDQRPAEGNVPIWEVRHLYLMPQDDPAPNVLFRLTFLRQRLVPIIRRLWRHGRYPRRRPLCFPSEGKKTHRVCPKFLANLRDPLRFFELLDDLGREICREPYIRATSSGLDRYVAIPEWFGTDATRCCIILLCHFGASDFDVSHARSLIATLCVDWAVFPTCVRLRPIGCGLRQIRAKRPSVARKKSSLIR